MYEFDLDLLLTGINRVPLGGDGEVRRGAPHSSRPECPLSYKDYGHLRPASERRGDYNIITNLHISNNSPPFSSSLLSCPTHPNLLSYYLIFYVWLLVSCCG